MSISVISYDDLIKKETKRFNRLNDKVYDKAYYDLETLFIAPLFYKSQEVEKLIKPFLTASNKKEVKKYLRHLFETIAQQHGLTKENHFDLTLRYTVCGANRQYRSYYSSHKRTVFINENSINNLFELNKKKRSKRLLYILVHEIAHALEDFYFNDLSNHGYKFHYCLTKIFQSVSGIKPNKIYRKVNIDKIPRFNESYYLDNSFDKHNHMDGLFVRSLNRSHIKEFVFDSFETAILKLSQYYSTPTLYEEKTKYYQYIDGEKIETFPSFFKKYYWHNKEIRFSHVENDIFDDYVFNIVRWNGSVKVILCKEKSFFMHKDKCFKDYVKLLHDNIVERNKKLEERKACAKS